MQLHPPFLKSVRIKSFLLLILILFSSASIYPRNIEDDDAFTCAIVAFNEGLYELSIEFLNKYFQNEESQKNDYALFLYAIDLLKLEKFQESLSKFEEFTKRFPDSTYKKDVWKYTITLQIFLNMPYDAWQTYLRGIPVFGKVTEIEKNLGQALLNEISKLLKADNIDRAKNTLDEMEQILSDTDIKHQITYYQGLILYRQDNFEACLKRLISALPYFKSKKFEPEILLKIGDCFFNLKNYQESQNYYTKVIAMFPKSIQAEWAKFQTSLVYRRTMKYKEARKILAELVKNTRNQDILIRSLWELGEISELEDKKQEAISWYEKITKLAGDDENISGARLRIGYVYFNQKQYEKAIEILSDYLKYKTDYDVMYVLGSACYNSGQTEKSIAVWEKIIEENPDYPMGVEALKEMYNFYKKNSNSPEMKKIFLKIWKDFPDDSFIITEGLLFLNEIINKGDIEEAEKYLKKFEPAKNPETDFLRAKLLYLSGNLDESQQILSGIEKKSIFAAEALYILAEINLKKSKIKDAQTCFVKIIASFPKTIWAQKAKEALSKIKSGK